MSPIEIVERYFACMRARDTDGLRALFAEDATFVGPDGRAFAGAAAIHEMFTKLFSLSAPLPTPAVPVAGPNTVAVEITTQLPDGSVRSTANFFHLDSAGLIQRLHAYKRG